MCGIAGILHLDRNRKVSEDQLNTMRGMLVHRGPDGTGIHTDGELGFVHLRLSIIDPSENSRQPFFSKDNRYCLTFNGEIFNYMELRMELETYGVRFRTGSDTEVLLEMYIKFGEKALDRLNGMFAFAVWDARERLLFLARDRMGIKPLYYSIFNQTLFFSSEPKALFKVGVPVDLREESLHELLMFKYVAGEHTVFDQVSRLLPGHSMITKDGNFKIKRWWALKDKIQNNRENLPKDPFEWFEATFYSSVKYRTISDVPVGIMLSGGLDSGSVAAALARNGERNLAAFTFVFDDPLYNEGPLARLVSDRFNLELHTVALLEKQLMRSLEEAVWFHDEPLVHQNDAQMLALSQVAKKKVSVLLSGEGADELMGGYMRYKPLNYHQILNLAKWPSRIMKGMNCGGIVNRFDKLGRYLEDSRIESLVLLNSSNVFPTDLNNLGLRIDIESFEYRNKMLKEAIEIYPDEPARQAMYLDLFTHMSSVLDRNDRMTMGAGIECRVPFLDYRLLEMIPALPTNYLLKGQKGKFLLSNSIAKKLPQQVLSFKKLGFSVPWEEYLKRTGLFSEYLSKIENGHCEDFVGDLQVKKVIENFKKGDTLSNALVRQLLMLVMWKEKYLQSFKHTNTTL